MRTFNTHLDCGVLGEAVPAEVELDYYPETDTDCERVKLRDVTVKLFYTDAAPSAYHLYHRLDNLTDAEVNNIEQAYLDQLDRVEG